MSTCKCERRTFSLVSPFSRANRNTFRQNLVSGDKSVVFPILQWLLEKLPEHKERSYLGRYLSKIDIPSEFLSDPEIAEQHDRVGDRSRNSSRDHHGRDSLCFQYDELMEEFKEVHRAYKEMTSTPHTIEDLRRDIKQLEDEKETLHKRLERQKTRIQKVPASQIELAKNYRKEVEKEEKLNAMKQDLANAIHQLEQKSQRLERQITDQRASSSDQSPEGSHISQTFARHSFLFFSFSDYETNGRRQSGQRLSGHRQIPETTEPDENETEVLRRSDEQQSSRSNWIGQLSREGSRERVVDHVQVSFL